MTNKGSKPYPYRMSEKRKKMIFDFRKTLMDLDINIKTTSKTIDRAFIYAQKYLEMIKEERRKYKL